MAKGFIMAEKQTMSLLSYAQKALTEYGTYTIEQRAVPDYRDGLKPVHRCILWSMYELGVKSTGRYVKSARVVGTVIGLYHPHGDSAVYQSMCGMVGVKKDNKDWEFKNCNVPLIEGYGNWGDNIDNAASMRYTECRLSEFAEFILLDDDYLAVTEMVPNFSEDKKMPLVLPAKLPILLLNGSVSIAVGVSAETPPFNLKGVVTLAKMAIAGKEITAQDCVKYLDIVPTYGGKCIENKNDLIQFYENGKGGIRFSPILEHDESKRTLVMKSFAPGITSQNSIITLVEQISNVEGVKQVSEETSRGGFSLVITMKNRGEEFFDTVKEVNAIILKKARNNYNIAVTNRKALDKKSAVESKITFRETTVMQILEQWAHWRIILEKRVIHHLIHIEENLLEKQELMALAIENLSVIMESLKQADSEAYLCKNLKIQPEQAKQIMQLQLFKLKSLQLPKVKEKIREHLRNINVLERDLKAPHKRVLTQLAGIGTLLEKAV